MHIKHVFFTLFIYFILSSRASTTPGRKAFVSLSPTAKEFRESISSLIEYFEDTVSEYWDENK